MSNFRIYRILCSTPPDLEKERRAFESSLANFAEHVTFPQQVLFAGASFVEGFDANLHRAAAESNVRMCDFFLHIFSSTWPGPAFQAYVDLAQTCLVDPARPMRRVAVLFKNFAAADEQVRSFRDSLAQCKCDLVDFREPEELDAVLWEIYASWWEAVQARP